MSGKHTQTGLEDERDDDDATGIPHGDVEGDQDPKASPDTGRQDSEVVAKT